MHPLRTEAQLNQHFHTLQSMASNKQVTTAQMTAYAKQHSVLPVRPGVFGFRGGSTDVLSSTSAFAYEPLHVDDLGVWKYLAAQLKWFWRHKYKNRAKVSTAPASFTFHHKHILCLACPSGERHAEGGKSAHEAAAKS